MHHLLKLLLLLLPLPDVEPAKAQTPLPEQFEEWILDGMDEWEIPGMALAIVHRDSVVYARGFGVRRLGTREPVDEQTLFGIASVTKNITAAALGMLVDEGMIDWDDRVRDHIPWFELSDPWVAGQVTIRDLLTHKVGLGRILGNRLQFMTRESRDELIYRMRYHEFEAPFRSRYVYSNVMYLVAGEIIPAVTGLSWDEFVENRFFLPLGMERANTSITQIADGENAAWPHQSIRDSVQAIPRRNWDNAAAAGGINASVVDVAAWLRMQLGEPGRFGDRRLLSRSVMRELHRPQVALPVSDPYDSQVSYGLGWQIYDYEGYRAIGHGGATDGMNTRTVMIPELELGIVVTSNIFTSYLDVVVNTLLDLWIDQPARDWNTLYLNRYRIRMDEALERRRQIDEARIEGTSPTLPMNSYAGIFYHDLYGRAEVRQARGGLELRLWGDGDMIADLEHWHRDTWRVVWRNPALREEFLYFTIGKEGHPDTLHFEFVLRPMLLQVGAYPSDYTRTVPFRKVGGS